MILVIRDLILDEKNLTNTYKNSPEASVPLLIPSKKMYFIGIVANILNNIIKFTNVNATVELENIILK